MGKKEKCSVTHILLVMGWNALRLHAKEKQMQCCSHPVMGWNAMRLHSKEEKNQCHSHPVGHVMRLHGKEKNAVSHTSCCSWDEMQWDCILKKTKCSVTHSLLVMGWNAMRLHCKEKQMQCHSHTVGHGMTCNEIEWWRQNDVLSLTYCWDGMWSDCTVNIYL